MEGTSQQTRPQLDELWLDFSAGDFTKDRLTELFKNAQNARSNSTDSDHDRIALQMAILYQAWLIDAETTWMAKAIIFNEDSSLSQKVKTFITWFGKAPAGGFAG